MRVFEHYVVTDGFRMTEHNNTLSATEQSVLRVSTHLHKTLTSHCIVYFCENATSLIKNYMLFYSVPSFFPVFTKIC